MPICAVSTCTTTHRTADKNVTMYKFPKDYNYARIWVRSCMKKDSFNTKSAFICSLHFSAEAYQRDINHDLLGLASKRTLRKDAVPTLQLPSMGMLRKNSVETFKTENVTSYYKAEKGGYPEEGISLLIDLMPGLSPKSFLYPKTSFDFFCCSRKNKCRTKLYTMKMKAPAETARIIHSSDSTEKENADDKGISEENYKSTALLNADDEGQELSN